jgi:large subunit ribosomal protein L24
MLVDPETKRATRVGGRKLEDGRRVRIAKRSGAQLDK